LVAGSGDTVSLNDCALRIEPNFKFDSAKFLKELDIFSTVIKPGQDIVSRSILFCFDPGGVACLHSYVTDRIVGAYSMVGFLSTNVDKEIKFILDYDSLVRALSFCEKDVYLVNRDKCWYLDFDGGSIFIPSFNIRPDQIFSDRFNKVKTVDFKSLGEGVYNPFSLARVFLNSGQSGYSSDLDFVFLKGGCSYLSNGYSVVKSFGFDGCDTAIRKSDVALLDNLFGNNSSLAVGVDKDYVYFMADKSFVYIPRCREEFPRAFMEILSKEHSSGDEYKIDLVQFYNALSMLSKIYNASGVAALESEGGGVRLESTTIDDKVSSIFISSHTKIDIIKMYFGVDNALASLKCLKQFSDDFNLFLSDESFCLYNTAVKVVVLGTNQAVRSTMVRMVS
jgi:hypothetical protein